MYTVSGLLRVAQTRRFERFRASLYNYLRPCLCGKKLSRERIQETVSLLTVPFPSATGLRTRHCAMHEDTLHDRPSGQGRRSHIHRAVAPVERNTVGGAARGSPAAKRLVAAAMACCLLLFLDLLMSLQQRRYILDFYWPQANINKCTDARVI